MSVQVRRRREAASFLASFVGAQGELIVDTTNNRVQVHDGATPGGFAAAKLSEVVTNTRTAVVDAGYSALSSDRMIAYTAITAPRIVALPVATAYPTGTPLLVVDESGASSAANTITLARAGTDLINGATSATISSAFGFISVESNGVSRWTIVDQSAGAAAATVTITGGTIDGTPIGATTKSSGAFTSLAVSSSLSLPANSVPNASFAQMPTLTVKANITGASATPVDSTVSAILDASQGSTRGAVLFRGASGWSALAPGSVGAVLTSNGTGADPSYQANAGASSPSVPIRQTVTGGPATVGAPSFLPASSASLTLTAQNVSSTTPLTLTAAQGYGASGALNYVNQFTASPSWASLAASTTCYLYVNAQTGTTSFATLPPLYQFGGTIAVTNGQFTFDYQAMTGYLGNGTSAVATPLVCIGEAVTSATAVTSAVAYAYNGFYDSGWTATLPSGNTLTSRAANLGLPPDSQRQAGIIFQNVTSDLGFVAGDTLLQNTAYQNAGPIMSVLNPVLTRNTIAFLATSNGFIVAGKTNGTIGTLTNANWKYKLVVGRGW